MTNDNQGKGALLARMAAQAGVSPADFYQTLCKTIMPDSRGRSATKEEVMALCMVADQYQLNPWLKEIYAFPNKNGGITPMMGYDGWCKLVARQSAHNGTEFRYADDGSWIECIMHRKDQEHPTVVREYLDECKRNTDPWRTMQRRMLRNRAFCQAARMCYGVTGIMLTDEAEAMNDLTVQGRTVAPRAENLEQLIRSGERAKLPDAAPGAGEQIATELAGQEYDDSDDEPFTPEPVRFRDTTDLFLAAEEADHD